MLRNLIDRQSTNTVLFSLILILLWANKLLLEKARVYLVLLALSSLWYAKTLIVALWTEDRISRLGAHAPSRWSWTPWNIGMLLAAVKHVRAHSNLAFWQDMFARYGRGARGYTVEAVTAGERVILTADEDNIKAILATQFADFGKGPQFRRDWKDFLGLSIFTTDGEIWHDSRMLLRPQFIKDRVSDLHTFEDHVAVLLPQLGGVHEGATVRADDLFFRFTLDAATDFLLGKSVDSLTNRQAEFADAFGEVQRVQSLIARAGPLNRFVPRKTFYQSLEILNRFVEQYIDQALDLSPEELEKKTKSDEGYTFLHAIAGCTRDREVLRDQLVAVLLAGRDTTAVTLSWLFYELSKAPNVVRKLREEIGSFVGFERVPTYADLKSMRFLQHTLNEILRMYPVVPYNVRVALKDTTLPSGGGPDGTQPIGVLKDTPVGYSTLVLQRRADIYPPTSPVFADPAIFSPERWDSWTPKSWTYIPFNGGPRICIGQQFALTEMAYTVVRILQTYESLDCKSEEFPGLKSEIVLQPARGVKVAFHKPRQEKSQR
ncbi:hypothetical protein MBLNU230_g0923t1 [Neophaeotheca triangularis]